MNSTIIARKSERGRRPQWIVRTLLLEAGVPWSDVRAMAPVEAFQLLRAMRSPTGNPSTPPITRSA